MTINQTRLTFLMAALQLGAQRLERKYLGFILLHTSSKIFQVLNPILWFWVLFARYLWAKTTKHIPDIPVLMASIKAGFLGCLTGRMDNHDLQTSTLKLT